MTEEQVLTMIDRRYTTVIIDLMKDVKQLQEQVKLLEEFVEELPHNSVNLADIQDRIIMHERERHRNLVGDSRDNYA